VVTPIVIWGATGQARVLAEFLPAIGYELIALFDNDVGVSAPIDGIAVRHGDKAFALWQQEFAHVRCAAIAAIGGAGGAHRLLLHERFTAAGFEIPTLAHPRAWIARNATIGSGSQLMAGAAVAAGARIGRACIVNTSASLDHDGILGDGVHLGPGATLAGEVCVGENAFIGTGAVVLPRVRIGARAIVGAGAVVVHDVADDETVVGNPARRLR